MKICPKCAAKYEDWANQCSDCQVLLEKIARRNEGPLEEMNPQPLTFVKDYTEGDKISEQLWMVEDLCTINREISDFTNIPHA